MNTGMSKFLRKDIADAINTRCHGFMFWPATLSYKIVVDKLLLIFQRLIQLCGEVKAAPSESEEISFLCTVCAKLKSDAYLCNFFIEVRENSTMSKKVMHLTLAIMVDGYL